MENNYRLFILLMTIFFIFGKIEIYGQEPQENTKDYYIKNTAEGTVIIQKIKWESEQGALEYTIHIEQKVKSAKKTDSSYKWKEIKKETVQTNEMDTKLSAGEYRYKIDVINILGQVEVVSEYYYFTIVKAYQPKIQSINIKHIFLDEENDGVFLISGNDFFETTKIKLDYIATNSGITEKRRKEYPGIILECSKNNKKLKVKFDLSKINAGIYRIRAENKSGLEVFSENIIIQFKKPMDLDFYGAYACSYMPGNSVLTDYFHTNFLSLGGKAGVSFIPLKTSLGYFGIGISSMFFPISYSETGYTLSANIITGTGLFVYQKPLIKHKLYWETHCGGGVMYLNNMKVTYLNGVVSPKEESLGITLDAGTSMQFYILKRMYAAVSLDYLFSFNDQFPRNIFYPSFCIGGQL